MIVEIDTMNIFHVLWFVVKNRTVGLMIACLWLIYMVIEILNNSYNK